VKRKGIIIATGGSAGNPIFRTMFDVRLTEEYRFVSRIYG
jgi:hypothetical protein